jgi:hypothetical protein
MLLRGWWLYIQSILSGIEIILPQILQEYIKVDLWKFTTPRQTGGTSNNLVLLYLKLPTFFCLLLIFPLILDSHAYTVLFTLNVTAFAIFEHQHMITGFLF